MSSIFDGGDFDTEVVTIPELKNLHQSLLEENIKLQIADPFETNMDCIEVFNEQCESLLEDSEDDPEEDSDVAGRIDSERRSFFQDIMNMIDNEYNLDLDLDHIMGYNTQEVLDTCEAMYSFFIIKRKKCIKTIIQNYCIANKDDICSMLDDTVGSDGVDVTSIASVKKFHDEKLARICANIHIVIEYFIQLDIGMDELVKYLDLDLFNNAKIADMIDGSLISSDFQSKYFAPIANTYNQSYDLMVGKIVNGIFKIDRVNRPDDDMDDD